MRLVTYSTSALEAARVGVLDANDVVDLTAAYAAEGRPLTRGMRQLLEEGEAGLAFAKACIGSGKFRTAVSSVRLLAPIYDPEKVVCIGMNYREHCTEQNFPIPTEPVCFSKFASAICASGEPIVFTPGSGPGQTSELDFEVELVIVVGKAGRHIAREDAMGHIAGWSVAHDVSARDWQLKKNGGQWLLGKTMDGYAPIGPAIVTRDELSDVSNLGVRCRAPRHRRRRRRRSCRRRCRSCRRRCRSFRCRRRSCRRRSCRRCSPLGCPTFQTLPGVSDPGLPDRWTHPGRRGGAHTSMPRACAVLNGAEVQNSNTSELIFKPVDIIVWLSSFVRRHADTPPSPAAASRSDSQISCSRNPCPLWLARRPQPEHDSPCTHNPDHRASCLRATRLTRVRARLSSRAHVAPSSPHDR